MWKLYGLDVECLRVNSADRGREVVGSGLILAGPPGPCQAVITNGCSPTSEASLSSESHKYKIIPHPLGGS